MLRVPERPLARDKKNKIHQRRSQFGECPHVDLGQKAMKSLYLLRHAKSSWKDPNLNDHERPLSKRGRRAAKMMARYFRRSKIAPDFVICSTALRAQQTLDPIIKDAKKSPKVILESEIYGGTQQGLWEQLWNIPQSAKSVLLIGHNPALHDLAVELAQADKLLPFAGEKFPMCAMASFRCQCVPVPPLNPFITPLKGRALSLNTSIDIPK